MVNELRKPDASDETYIVVNIGYSKQFGGIMMGLNDIYYTGPDATSAYGSKDKATGKIRVPPMLEPFTMVENQVDSLNSLRIMTLVEGDIEKDAERRGRKVPHIYLNYTSSFQDPFASYGEENKKFLREVSRRYDPHGLF
ncbi:hypothetical protein F4820DRAFT_408617 [Hypoxylon rubiginosum]|uniref:Uncharacterized protein n=1 Tax=Hypoxylon rubiginosum TaxID=110542 RepID=A0ACB9ZB04_9PEZI|nr:hypothetical protein F4820DRAFT_408617 [Hypoxylon rubiginosum]